MIGFDRPLRPRWIYESLLQVRPGDNLSDLNKPFENIARELTGKEGKRKARTVLFRCFLRDEKNMIKAKSPNFLKDLSMEYGLDFMTPIYLFYLIGRTRTLFTISDYIFRLYNFDSEINVSFLKQKLASVSGERDVVVRSVGAFIKTLNYFNIVTTKANKVFLKRKLTTNNDQTRIMMMLFAKEILRAPQISLNHLPNNLFNYFQTPNLNSVAQKYNGKFWDYQHGMKEDLIIVH